MSAIAIGWSYKSGTNTTSPNTGPGLGVRSQEGCTAAGLDAIHGGKYRITGTVKVTPATPAYRKVTLFDSVSRLLIREVWSDPVTGAYAFNNIRPGTFFVMSVDHTNTHNAVIADRLVAEPMP